MYSDAANPPTLRTTINYGYSTGGWGDLLTSFNGKTVTYEQAVGGGNFGNMASDGIWTYTWEHGRQLKSMSKSGASWTFAYDANGMRTQRSNGSTTYTYSYDGSRLSGMTVGSNELWFAYGATGMPMAVEYNGTIYYYVTNIQGDVIAILNGSGTAVVTYIYDAWGNILTTGGSMASTLGAYNPLRYRSYVYDQETQLYYLQSRYYNPAMGRYICADGYVSTGQGILGNNMFVYCGNNPVNCMDPSGRSWIAVLLVVTLCGIVLTGCSQPTSDVGAAKPYVDMAGSDDPSSPNCYAYAIGAPVNMQPGVISGKMPTDYSDVDNVWASVKGDLDKLGYRVRPLTGPNDKVYDNEFKIAFRVGTQAYGYDRFGNKLYDYHFMVQTDTGAWAEKHGYGGSSVLWPVGMTPDTIPWTLDDKPYYDSKIIYAALGK